MNLGDLDFQYPDSLIATEPARPSRVLFTSLTSQSSQELKLTELLDLFQPGDTLAYNTTRVVPRRVFTEDGAEILFLRPLVRPLNNESVTQQQWQVLFIARELKLGATLTLPGGRQAQLSQKGLPQVLTLDQPLDELYFTQHAEPALPPYIQVARGERQAKTQDLEWYQTAWAHHPGSVAAPTASLHFSQQDLLYLQAKGVKLAPLTLHVGIGTFLPIKCEKVEDHTMHTESVYLPASSWQTCLETQRQQQRVWALGTTVTRALESAQRGLLERTTQGDLVGDTNLFIYPPFNFQIVSGLLTNFHQPRSTLLALVAAFAGLERTQQVYKQAIENKFKLFSYGDLSAWIK